jgi:hypothetical protein
MLKKVTLFRAWALGDGGGVFFELPGTLMEACFEHRRPFTTA